MTELPPPARPGDESSPYPAARKSYYDADQMRAYAEEAIKQERARCTACVDDFAAMIRAGEKPLGLARYYTPEFNAIRARSSAPDAPVQR